MTEKNRETWGKIIAGTAALVMGLSMAGCANSSDDNNKEEKAETTTTTVAAETEAPEETEPTETETVTEEETEAETTTETTSTTENSSAAVTNVSEDLDAQLDAMIASAEAMISEMDAAFGTNSKSNESTDGKTVKTTDTTAEATTPAASASSLTNEQQFIFDGVTYDNSTFTSEGITKPAGWTLNTKASSGKEYINSAYEDCAIVEGQSKGASFMMHQAKQNGKTTLPPLTLYKGLTWGASASDIKAAFGTPAKESNKDNYGTSMTNLFYSGPDGSLIVYEVSADWGLIVIECFGK
jgi:hypothetical protein